MILGAVGSLAATTAVVVLAVAHRPRAAVRRPLMPAAAVTPRTAPAEVVGSRLRQILGRTPDPLADRRVGRVVLVAIVLAVVEPALALLWSVGWAVGGVVRRRARARERRRRLVDELPEVVDLLSLAVSSGLTVPLALRVVADRGVGEIAAGLGRAGGVADRGGALADALDALVVDIGEEVRSLVRVLAGALRDGTSIIPALDRLAAEVRTSRRRAAEERARRLPVQLLFPLVVCVLPAFALLTVVPLLAGALQGLPR